jgi:ABC-2 type transport system ATP-binding protein
VHTILSLKGVSKTYAGGHVALKPTSLDIGAGEIFALLGPNGAGKSTLINIVCGIVRASAGTVTAAGHDIARDWRAARQIIGLAPQELHTDAFEPVAQTLTFSRGLFGKPRNDALLEQIMRDLSLWDKRDAKIMTLSGGMKRRVMIAKALAHEPQILFLDEPTAGVDVELRQDMWRLVHRLRLNGVTIILTTHYIEEAEEMADRVGVIRAGELILVEEKAALMAKLGGKSLTLTLEAPITADAPALAGLGFALSEDGRMLTYAFQGEAGEAAMATALRGLIERGVRFHDLNTSQRSLEEIFVGLLKDQAA